MSEVRYYASWLNKQGFDLRELRSSKSHREVCKPNLALSKSFLTLLHNQQRSNMMQTPDHFNEPDPMEKMLENQMSTGKGGEGRHGGYDGILDLATKMQMQQQQFQMQMMMQQRQFDQQREADMRREQMARDQQFMNQQTTLLRESFKRANDGGFQGKMQQALEEKLSMS